MKKMIFIIVITFNNIFIFGQYNPIIVSSRPGQVTIPNTVGLWVIHLETGCDIGSFRDAATDIEDAYVAPYTFIRVGLSPRIELNSYLGVRQDFMKYGKDSTASYSGLNILSLGLRVNLIEADGYKPAVGLQLSFQEPILSTQYNAQYMATRALLSITQKLFNQFFLTLNLGENYNGSSASPDGLYVLNLAYLLSEKITLFAENYATFNAHSLQDRWDGGVAYIPSQNIQWDIYAGFGTNQGIKDKFVSIGYSYRFNQLHK